MSLRIIFHSYSIITVSSLRQDQEGSLVIVSIKDNFGNCCGKGIC